MERIVWCHQVRRHLACVEHVFAKRIDSISASEDESVNAADVFSRGNAWVAVIVEATSQRAQHL